MPRCQEGMARPGCQQAVFRFYEELNDFLSPDRRKHAFVHPFTGTPSVKDVIEALGVPHTEVDLILVDGRSVGFDHRLRGGERVAVYPVFEALDISPLNRLRPVPLRRTRFILDVHLGKLARYLRLMGFDALYRNDYDDSTIIGLARTEHRIILTRDRGLLKHGSVTHGYWLRNTEPRSQLLEIVRAFDLRRSARPFSRCLQCNVLLESVDKGTILADLPPRVRQACESFARCPGCQKLYWPGTHYQQMKALLVRLNLFPGPGQYT